MSEPENIPISSTTVNNIYISLYKDSHKPKFHVTIYENLSVLETLDASKFATALKWYLERIASATTASAKLLD